VEVVASFSQGRTAAAQCGLFTHKSVPVIFEPPCNSNTNENIATKFEQEYVRCVRNEKECVCSAPNCWDTEQRSASQPGSVASGTHGRKQSASAV